MGPLIFLLYHYYTVGGPPNISSWNSCPLHPGTAQKDSKGPQGQSHVSADAERHATAVRHPKPHTYEPYTLNSGFHFLFHYPHITPT